METFERMMDDAATCCQRMELLDNETVRLCVKLNVYDRLMEEVERLQEERDDARNFAKHLQQNFAAGSRELHIALHPWLEDES